MLQVKDLMVGDWVMTSYGPHKTDVIYGGCERVQADLIELDCSEIQPIPLTPEILEKNGFKQWNDIDGTKPWRFFEAPVRIEVTVFDEPLSGCIYVVDVSNWSHLNARRESVHSTIIESVHQLQHALRLCGIEKEIIL